MSVPDPKSDILVVDDLADNLLVYQCVLEELGQNILSARSGDEALKLVLQHDFAVILLDVNMPGMDGFETASLIRQRKKSARTPIIFLTAFSDELPPSRAYASGAVDFISTPVVPEILRAKVRVFVELHQLRQQTALQAEERGRRAAAEEAVCRSSFLAAAGRSLAASLDFETTLNTLAGLTIPLLGDLGLVCVVEGETQKPARSAASALDMPAAHWAWMAPEGCCAASDVPPVALHQPIGHVLEEGKPVRWQRSLSLNLPAEVERALLADTEPSSGNGHYPVERSTHAAERASPTADAAPQTAEITATAEITLCDILLLPLRVRSTARGVLCLGRTAQRPRFSDDEVTLAYELAARGGMAIENTLLVRSIREADRRKDDFLAMLAHELRNPLAPVRNAVHLLKRLGRGNQDLEQARDLIDRQVTHLARLVDDLLDATRIARGKVLLRKERCDLARIVQQAVDDYRDLFRARELRLEVEVPPGPVWVEGDATRLTQVASNLLSNAQKFTEPGGEVHVRLTLEAEGQATLRVRDTGIGIDPQMLPNIFEVFMQADRSLERVRGGLGLGLALVKGLVNLHGGDVRATSAGVGRGAELVIRLPVLSVLNDAALSQEVSGHTISNGTESPTASDGTPSMPAVAHRVLLVEDNRDAALTAARLLELAGHDVQTAHAGAAALEMAREFGPNVILCDIGLPGGMNGYDVARAVRADPELASVYLVALTGYGREEDRRQAEEAGFDLHLTKPVDCQKLEELLGSRLARERRPIRQPCPAG